jgi:hypothetical protein
MESLDGRDDGSDVTHRRRGEEWTTLALIHGEPTSVATLSRTSTVSPRMRRIR